MAQGLYLSQKMQLSQVLSPQMQQSLALLQAQTLELKAMVEQELQQNPVLEEILSDDAEPAEKGEAPSEAAMEAAVAADPTEPPSDVTFDPAVEKSVNDPVDDFQAEFEKLALMDQDWRDQYTQSNAPMRASQEDEERRQFMFDSLVAATSLQEQLLEQVGADRALEPTEHEPDRAGRVQLRCVE